ncbi:HAD family hydrolase [Paraburkholderia dipogonis]|uniref:HAD family hydrolase n=1 Tax=Paraburkholderia dipogonis TaxID=1211383 RepID=A0A4Y8MI55_9BURK|nr:HAD-IA family hydrolase [Paraburkholderia dipogonis]TFE37053.1 HAD family hydrolase [Paraburkholderia dipogonis]
MLEDYLMICDCDGVLVDSEAIAERIIVSRLEDLWHGSGIQEVVRPLLGFRTGTVLARTAATLSRSIDQSQIVVIEAAVRAAAVSAPMIEGIAEALSAIPLRKACASNSNAEYVRDVLDRTKLVRFFGERRFTADMVPNPKPAADVYLAAARRLRVAPERCIVVEDSVAGATAAVSAGMTVLGYIGGAHSRHEHANKLTRIGARNVFDHMKQLPGLVETWVRTATGATTAPSSNGP